MWAEIVPPVEGRKRIDLEILSQQRIKIKMEPKSGEIYIPFRYQKGLVLVNYDGERRPTPTIENYAISEKTYIIGEVSISDHKTKTFSRKGYTALFYIERPSLDLLVKTNKADEWISKKAVEIVAGHATPKERVERLVEYLSMEVEYSLIPKEEINRFAQFLSEEI